MWPTERAQICGYISRLHQIQDRHAEKLKWIVSKLSDFASFTPNVSRYDTGGRGQHHICIAFGFSKKHCGCGRNWSWPNLKHYLGICLQGLREPGDYL